MKDLEIEVGMTHVFIILMFAVLVKGYQGTTEACKAIGEGIARFIKWARGMPEWKNEVIERINQQVGGIEMRLRQREDEEKQEAEWDVVADTRFIEERDRRLEE